MLIALKEINQEDDNLSIAGSGILHTFSKLNPSLSFEG